MVWSRPPRAATLTLAAASVFVVTGCSSSKSYTCTDANNVVVSDDRCEGDSRTGGRSYFLHSYSRDRYGSQPPIGTALADGGDRFLASDKGARTAAGLSSTGRVSSGTTVRSGGFGSGKGGSFGG